MFEDHGASLPERGLTYLGADVRRNRDFPRQEVEAALQTYFAVAEQASLPGDWQAWADLFTEDAIYVEHGIGVFHGRDGIREWVVAATQAMSTGLKVTDEWHVIDNDLCIVYASNWRAASDGGQRYGFNAVALLCYAGGGQWCYEEDLYNAVEAGRVMQAHAAAQAACAHSAP